jgi:branched-chain amino acid transport system substrate-binding protein
MRKAKFILLVTVVMSVLIALPLFGCAPGAPPEEKYVTFLSLSDLTGPGAGLVFPVVEAMNFGFEDINAKGGVDGVKLNVVTVDTRYDTARTVSAYKRYRTEHKVLYAFIPLTPGVKALEPLMKADKVPSMTPADGEFQAHIGWVFLAALPYQDGFAASLDWMLKDWKAKGNQGAPAVGYLSWDSAYGREALRGGKEYAEKMGVKLLNPEFFPTGSADHTVWLSRINDSGASYCFIGGVDPTQSLILRDAAKLGLTKKIQFVSDFWGLDENVGIKVHPEATEGAVLVSPFVRGDEGRKIPYVVETWNRHMKAPISESKALFPGGVLMSRHVEQALKIALKDVGYDKMDGEAMYKAYQKLTGFDSGGVMGPGCAYSPTSRKSNEFVRFYRVQSGKTVPITDWVKAPDAVSLYPDW